jgi:hypothetical protein
MQKPEGLNGNPIFNAEDVPVGRVSGASYGHKRRLLVTVSIRMEELTRRGFYDTVDHKIVREPLDFAITTGVWQPGGRDIVSGGATVEPLRELASYEMGWTPESVKELADLEEWHLNGMSAACAHQERRAGLDSPPCPISGYRWGSAWLVRPLPNGFLSKVENLFAHADEEKIWTAWGSE